MKDFVVKKHITIKAPVASVWDALTNPEKTKKYFFNCRVQSTWKPGSDIEFKGRIFWIFPIKLKGVIDKIATGKLLQYTLFNSDDKTKSIVTDELSYVDGVTILKITDDVGQGEGARARYEKSEDGWDKVLRGLKELCEKQAA